MNDLDTFERRLVRDLHDATGDIHPDLDRARSGVNARLLDDAAQPGGSGRGMFLAVAASITLVVGAGTFALTQSGADDGSAAANSTTVPTTAPESVDESEAAITEDASAAEPSDEAIESDEAGAEPVELPDGLAWDQVAAPTAPSTDGNAVQVESTIRGSDGVGRTTATADDGRIFSIAADGTSTEVDSPTTLAIQALAANRSASADEATAAALRAIGTDPDRATTTTVQTRVWFTAVDAFASASLDQGSWADTLRFATSIENVRLSERTDASGASVLDVTFHHAPDGGTWQVTLDAATGWPIESIRLDRDGNEDEHIAYAVSRVTIEDPEPPVVAAAGSEIPIVVGPLGIEVKVPDSDEVVTALWGTDEDDLLPILDVLLGENLRAADRGCPANPVLDAIQWNGLSLFFIQGKLVGWFVDGTVEAGASIAASNGVSIGSTIADLQTINPGLTLNPDGPLGNELFDGAVSFFTTDGTSSGIVDRMQSGQTCVSG